jgi:hypothetical protein
MTDEELATLLSLLRRFCATELVAPRLPSRYRMRIGRTTPKGT